LAAGDYFHRKPARCCRGRPGSKSTRGSIATIVSVRVQLLTACCRDEAGEMIKPIIAIIALLPSFALFRRDADHIPHAR